MEILSAANSGCDRAQPLTLERLPLHVFEYICTFLPHRSLLDLSLASRRCAQAAAHQQYSRIRLDVFGVRKLRSDLERWTAILSQGDRFRHVRRVVVVGFFRNGWNGNEDSNDDSDDDDDSESESDSDTDNDGYDRYIDLEARTYNDTDSESGDDAPGRRFQPNDPVVVSWRKKVQNKAWLPFAQFLAQTPGLKDLVYSQNHQLPRCVLDVLHEHHPRCRLHLRIFSLRSLYQDRDHQHGMDPDELALVSSPCLYSIHITYEDYDRTGRFNFNLDAVEEMVAGYAPNLKRVRIHVRYLDSEREPLPKDNIPWIGFPRPASEQPGPLARLETLAVSGWISGCQQLTSWNNRIDFSCLQHFDFGARLDPEGFATLTSMAANGKFQSLRTLGLGVSAESYLHNNHATLDGPASLFLQALPPLKTVRLAGHFSNLSLTALLARHGPTLRTLHLLPARSHSATLDTYGPPQASVPPLYHTATVIAKLAASCPALRTLSLVVQRHGGGPAEVAAYRALAGLPRLERASLFLDCRALPGDLSCAWNNAEELQLMQETERRWSRESLRNCAVDETLARAIFGEITAARGGTPLEWLWVEPVVPGAGTIDGFETVGRWVGRSWVCEMRSGGRLAVKEVRGKDLEWGVRLLTYRNDLLSLEDFAVEQWEAVWPRSAVGDWRNQWSSFPLVGE